MAAVLLLETAGHARMSAPAQARVHRRVKIISRRGDRAETRGQQ